MSKYTRKETEIAIIAHFGEKDTKKKLAESLKLSQSQISRNLKNLPEAFIQRLKGVGVPLGNSIIKEKEAEYGGLSLVKQIKLLEERNQAINIEFEKVKAQIIQLKKDCGNKEGCLVKNIKIENET